MSGPEDTPTVANAGLPNFHLTPPALLMPVSAEAARIAVPLTPEAARSVQDHVHCFIDALMSEDLHSAATQAKVDAAVAYGRHEIAQAAGLMQGRFLQHDVIEIEAGPACQAIAALRHQLDALDPAHEGDLLAPRRLLGLIPYGSKLKTYLQKFDHARPALLQTLIELRAAGEAAQAAIVDIEAARHQLWEAMQQLAAAAQFALWVDDGLSERLPALVDTDPVRVQLLEHEVLVRTRLNFADILNQQAACVSGYLLLDVLKRTGREALNGCGRLATTTGNLVAEACRQPPSQEVGKLRELFDQARQAVDAMDSFRAAAKSVLRQNDSVMAEQIARGQPQAAAVH